ncbi:Imm6 family immunity protein [Tuwongella immobilis]|uniref:: Imm6 n=1 Tax=Tuwongella immobilis TaxID=692036 RepID=A0A6C2YQL5_9BACT|nr:Imm6 family immunity protein [Tuwongella immobilis]VIP03647.1 : Imm6 [Tuwongella immobilis]VTS04662.1 : Imm6 [Tuwongella immobilis]
MIPQKVWSTTVRGRCAWSLFIGEHGCLGIRFDEASRKRMMLAYEIGWKWVAGEQIANEDLYLILESENEEDCLLIDTSVFPENSPGYWNVALTPIVYVVWWMKYLEGVKSVSTTVYETIADRFETFYQSLVELGLEDLATRILNQIVQMFPTTAPDDLGSPFDRNELLSRLALDISV